MTDKQAVERLIEAVRGFLKDEDAMHEQLLAEGVRDLEGYTFPRVIEMRSALAAIGTQPRAGAVSCAVPVGYRLVPEEPTFAMEQAGCEAAWPGPECVYDDAFNGPEQQLRAGYKAMLSAAPKAPVEGEAIPCRITDDAANPNNLRIHAEGYGQLCKVYGFNREEAKAKADLIVRALSTPSPVSVEEIARVMVKHLRVEGLGTVNGFITGIQEAAAAILARLSPAQSEDMEPVNLFMAAQEGAE